ncbi:MAG: hypothetical protein ACLRYE_00775 [Gemmiger formicilis]|uniref:hypothetical protein n=1 Tax=Gemmiger formicilis TaxID=745368 RepID=UPI0039A0F7D6
MMFTGKTKSGFTYCIPEKRIQNMELLDALTELETNGAALPKVVNLLLDANAKQKLYDHVRDEDGTVPVRGRRDGNLRHLPERQAGKKLLTLACMAARFPDELTCDMAETYHALDWRALGLPLAATLAAGLRETAAPGWRLPEACPCGRHAAAGCGGCAASAGLGQDEGWTEGPQTVRSRW